jgi:hypothetical protein
VKGRRVAAVLILAALFFWYRGKPLKTTPGFFIDESSIAYNAWSVSETGRDEHGVVMPVYFKAFGEYKNPVYIYLLAALYRVYGPSSLAARTLSIALGFFAALVLGFLVWRMTNRRIAGVFTFLAALVTPWRFEISRLVFEVAAFPLALALALLAVAELARRDAISWPVAIGCGGALASVTYTYTAGRLLGPLMAIGLLLLLPRQRLWRVWIAYAVFLIPLVTFAIAHPDALTARLMEIGVANGSYVSRYFASFSPEFLLTTGDTNARHHVPYGGMLFLSLVIVALLGLIVTIRKRDAFSRYLLFMLFIAPLPGAITGEPPHALRLVTIGVIAVVLAGIGLSALQTWRYAAVAIVFLAVVVQGLVFRRHFDELGPQRIEEFNARYPNVLYAALAVQKPPIGLELTGYYIHGWWYGMQRGIDRSQWPRYVRGTEPKGMLMIGNVPACETCRVIADDHGFIAYRRE